MQELIVGLIVTAAASYAVWHWLPAAWRKRLGGVHPSLSQSPGCSACEAACGGCASADAPAKEAGTVTARRVIPIVAKRDTTRSD